MYRTITESTHADDLAVSVDGHGDAIAAEGAEIDHPACRRPREGMSRTITETTPPDDLAVGVRCPSCAVGAAEGAEIDHPARLRPQKRTAVARTDDLAAGIHIRGGALAAAERAEINRNERPFCRVCGRVCGEEYRDQQIVHGRCAAHWAPPRLRCLLCKACTKHGGCQSVK